MKLLIYFSICYCHKLSSSNVSFLFSLKSVNRNNEFRIYDSGIGEDSSLPDVTQNREVEVEQSA